MAFLLSFERRGRRVGGELRSSSWMLVLEVYPLVLFEFGADAEVGLGQRPSSTTQVGSGPVDGGLALGHRERRGVAERRPEEELGGVAQVWPGPAGCSSHRGSSTEIWFLPWLATVAPLVPALTRSLRMVTMVSSWAWSPGGGSGRRPRGRRRGRDRAWATNRRPAWRRGR